MERRVGVGQRRAGGTERARGGVTLGARSRPCGSAAWGGAKRARWDRAAGAHRGFLALGAPNPAGIAPDVRPATGSGGAANPLTSPSAAIQIPIARSHSALRSTTFGRRPAEESPRPQLQELLHEW